MTSKTDKVGEVLDNILNSLDKMTEDNFFDVKTKVLSQARHALLEVIKAELPKKLEEKYPDNPKDFKTLGYIHGFNQSITEVNAILERLFLKEV